MKKMENLLNTIKFDEKGLVPVIIQEIDTNKVLMLGFMNREALIKTLEEGRTCFWSRSRQRLWVKGEESGYFQQVRSIYLNCENNSLLLKVTQTGGASCHTGYVSCYYQEYLSDKDAFRTVEKKIFSPKDVYLRSGE